MMADKPFRSISRSSAGQSKHSVTTEKIIDFFLEAQWPHNVKAKTFAVGLVLMDANPCESVAEVLP